MYQHAYQLAMDSGDGSAVLFLIPSLRQTFT